MDYKDKASIGHWGWKLSGWANEKISEHLETLCQYIEQRDIRGEHPLRLSIGDYRATCIFRPETKGVEVVEVYVSGGKERWEGKP